MVIAINSGGETKSTTASFFKVFIALLALVLVGLPVPSRADIVRFSTVVGPVDIVLYDASAPLTVANFLRYVTNNAYNDSFIHRSVPHFVIQGGGYNWPSGGSAGTIATGSPVANEFSPTRPNIRGSVAMAKVSGNPNSAASQWFINLADNSATLDTQNGGYTVFGRVTTPGLKVVDAIAALQVVNAGSQFPELPITSRPASGVLQRENLVMLNSAYLLNGAAVTSDSDRLFNYLEAAYPEYISLPISASGTALGYYYRYYAAKNAYLGTANGMVYYLVPSISNDITLLGPLSEWLAIATAAGY